jgi:hypothetical protein
LLITLAASACIHFCTGCGNGTAGQPEALAEVPNLTLAVSDSLEGGAAGGPPFGAVADVAVTGDGGVLVLDAAACCVYGFDSDGNYVGEKVSSGPGPGELGYPSCLTLLEDGTLAVNDPMKASVLLFSPDSGYIGSVDGFPMTPVSDMHPSPGGGFIGWRSVMEQGDEGYDTAIRVCRWTSTADPDAVYWERVEPADFSSFAAMLKQSLFAVSVTADQHGRVFVAPLSSEDYTIHCFYPDGENYRTLSLPLPRTPRTEEEIETEVLMMENRMRSMGDHGMPAVWEADPYRTMVGDMGTDSDGLLWVRRGTEENALFDVFDPATGERLFTADIDYRGDTADWTFRISPQGFVSWPLSAETVQKIYFLESPGLPGGGT